MSKQKSIDLFKNLIKECVREVIREELNTNIQEVQEKPFVPNTHLEELKREMNEQFRPNHYDGSKTNGVEYMDRPESTGNPMLDMINETKNQMSAEDFQSIGNFGSQAAPNFSSNNTLGTPVSTVKSAKDMLESSTKSSNINQVEINAVPDFSEMMGAMGLKK